MEEGFHCFVESGVKGDGGTGKVQPQTDLTYSQVYWANKIENPLVSLLHSFSLSVCLSVCLCLSLSLILSLSSA